MEFWASCRWRHSFSDWYRPEAVGGAVSSEDRFVFQLDVDILVPQQVHSLRGEDGGAVGITGLSN